MMRSDAEDRFNDKWIVYNCICAEIDLNGTLHVLAAGEWYAIVLTFVDRINGEIAQIPTSAIDLPPYQENESEGEYNQRVAAIRERGLHLFDKNLVQFEGERGRVEFCDLLSEQKHIFHVKKRNRSSLLSHLFMQGYVSAEAFLDYLPLRQQIRASIPAIQHLIPELTPTPSEYEVVFAMLYRGDPTLPFFSKVALAGIYKQLRRMQYRVSLCWVTKENDE